MRRRRVRSWIPAAGDGSDEADRSVRMGAMSERREAAVGPEDLAGLMDGTLTADRRAEVLRALAVRPDLREELASAASAVGADTPPVSRPRERTWWRPWYGLAAAAGIAALVLVVQVRDGAGPDPGLPLLQEPAVARNAGSGAMVATFGDRWAVPLPARRGEAPAALPPGDAAFLLGAYATRWTLALERSDTAAASGEAAILEDLLRTQESAAPLRAMVADATARMAPDPEVARRLDGVRPDDGTVAAGRWAESLRLLLAAGGSPSAETWERLRSERQRILATAGIDPRLERALRAFPPTLETPEAAAALDSLYALIAR